MNCRKLVRSASVIIVASCLALFMAVRNGHAQVQGLTGTIVVTNKSASTATIIDLASGRALATLPTGEGPHEIAITANGETAVVTDYQGPAGRTLTVIDIQARTVVRTIDLGEYRRPHGIAFLPGDSLVAVTSEASQHVVIVNILQGVVRRAIPTRHAGSHMLGVTADASRIYTGDIGSNTVSELNARTGEYVRSFNVPREPEAINVTPDGSEVWVGSNAEGKISVVDPQSGSVRTAAEGFGWPYRILFTPDTRTVLLPDLENETLRFVDRASHRELGRISFTGGGPQGITVTPDGKYALESMSKQNRVAIIDLSSRTVAGYVEAGPTPDGIVYTSRVFR